MVDLPFILKGVATAEDAALAVEHGIDTIYVSNHGGRQLDHGRATIDVLPEIVESVSGKAKIVLDGGIVRGSDVLKAIALGARALTIGKLQGWGLAAAGQAGLVRVLELLEREILRLWDFWASPVWISLVPLICARCSLWDQRMK